MKGQSNDFSLAADYDILFDQVGPYSGWEQGFETAANLIMDLGSPYCGTIDECAETMNNYFKGNVELDESNNYVTLVFCAAEGDHKPDTDGNVWWYDHIQVSVILRTTSKITSF